MIIILPDFYLRSLFLTRLSKNIKKQFLIIPLQQFSYLGGRISFKIPNDIWQITSLSAGNHKMNVVGHDERTNSRWLSPMTAIKYQIAIMAAILGSVVLTGYIVLTLEYHFFFKNITSPMRRFSSGMNRISSKKPLLGKDLF